MIRLCTVFAGFRRLAAGQVSDVAVVARRAIESGSAGPVLIFDDATGEVIDLEMGIGEEEMVERLRAAPEDVPHRGRPKLGVVAREITLLPRHWDWLRVQPGGASVALRKLVEEARRADGTSERARARRDAGYRFMSAIAGDLPGFEEASRALFAGDREGFSGRVAEWPEDVREQALGMAFGEPV